MIRQDLIMLSTKVSNAMRQYPGWKSQPPGAEKAWRKYVSYAPVIISSRLRRPIDLTEILAGRLDWTHFILQFNAPKEIYGFYEKSEIARIAENISQLLLMIEANQSIPPALNKWAKRINTQLSDSELQPPFYKTEREALSALGLSKEALSLYDQGKLTVEELLIRQPWLIISV